jgi:hypothetical protein
MRSQLLVFCIVWLASSCLVRTGRAQAPIDPSPTELLVAPRAIEQPLLAHRLMPAEYELRDGNAAPIILRLAWEQTKYFTTVVPTFEEQLKLPLNDPKLIEAGPMLKPHFYEELRRAAHRRTAQWEYPLGEQNNLEIMLPDSQAARQIAGRGLSVWIRHQLASGDLNKAEEAIRVGFGVNRHYGRTPIVVTKIITVALNGLLLQRLEELIAQPGSANYYWPLTALPRPLVNLQPALELERNNLMQAVDELRRLDEPRTAEEWSDLDRTVFQLYFDWSYNGAKPPTDDERKQAHQRAVERARAELPASPGNDAGRATPMSDSEALVRWLVDQHCRQTDEVTATMQLQPPLAIPALRSLQERLTRFREEIGFGGLLFAETPLNLFVSVNGLQRRIDGLRTVEAIRHYAATHAGNLPESLDQMVDTPIPHDPLTGDSFRYVRAPDGAAVLSAPPTATPTGQYPGLRYRVVLRDTKPAGAK